MVWDAEGEEEDGSFIARVDFEQNAAQYCHARRRTTVTPPNSPSFSLHDTINPGSLGC